jgi:uncharacterized membrane protein
MQSFDYFILARVFHIIGIVLWIGGVAFVTLVLLPSLKKIANKQERMTLFEKLEGAFSFQAKFSTLITGLSGVYMLEYMNAWSRYLEFQFWWMHLMTLVWFIFTVVLFVLEPLFLHKWFNQQAKLNCDKTFKYLHIMHIVLLSISLIAIFGAAGGVHGLSFI